jgi:hypothetical protein
LIFLIRQINTCFLGVSRLVIPINLGDNQIDKGSIVEKNSLMVETGSLFINNEPVAETAVEAINNIENSLKAKYFTCR